MRSSPAHDEYIHTLIALLAIVDGYGYELGISSTGWMSLSSFDAHIKVKARE